MLSGVRDILKKNDEEIRLYAAAMQSDAPQFRSVPRIEAPYTEHSISAHAEDLPQDYAKKIFDLVAQLGMFNTLVEESKAWNRMVFAPGITPENHAAAQKNADVGVRGVSERARIIIRKIASLEKSEK